MSLPDVQTDAEVRIATLRASGADRLDPVRFRRLEALARRLGGVPDAARALLQHKLAADVDAYAERFAQAQVPARPVGRAAPAGRRMVVRTPLAELNEYMRRAATQRGGDGVLGESAAAGELASARRFRSAWERGHSLEQVEQALARRPANAGPLNSHALVLQSLALMRELSPDYLRRFIAQVETLQWLELAQERAPRTAAGKPKHARRSPARKQA